MPYYTAVYILSKEKPLAFTSLDLFKPSHPKNSITPAGVTPNGQKSKKNFLDFWHQNDSIREKKQKKILTQNLVLECLECVECGPKKGQDAFLGSSVIHC